MASDLQDLLHSTVFIKSVRIIIMETEINEADKRKFSRVDAFIPMSYRLVPSEEQAYIQSKINRLDLLKEDTDAFPDILQTSTCLLSTAI
jgi:hypothetical protein